MYIISEPFIAELYSFIAGEPFIIDEEDWDLDEEWEDEDEEE
jgi:hypothetical protein